MDKKLLGLIFDIDFLGEGSSNDQAEFRLQNNYSSGGYLNLGTSDGDDFDASNADWVYAGSGNTSPYSKRDEGTYRPITDGDSDHSTAFVVNGSVTVDSGKKYTFIIDSDGYMTYTED
jgi:hypothetical protein